MRVRLLRGEEVLKRDLVLPPLRGLEPLHEVASGVVLRIGEGDGGEQQSEGQQSDAAQGGSGRVAAILR